MCCYLSNKIHVSAVWRLMPKPPARVDIKKAKMLEPGALNAFTSTCHHHRRVRVRKTRVIGCSNAVLMWLLSCYIVVL